MRKNRGNFFTRIAGEMASALRETSSNILGGFNVTANEYTLKSVSKIDYKLARQLYRNTHEKYKLGAWACRPIINAVTGFMGAPKWRSDDKNAQQVLNKTLNTWLSKLLTLQRNTLREGDCYTIFSRRDLDSDPTFGKLYKGEKARIEMKFLLPERCTPITAPHDSDRLEKFIVKTPVRYRDTVEKIDIDYVVIETWTDTSHEFRYDGRAVPPELKDKSEPNPWGFIPVIWFRNENEDSDMYGASELEPVEPFIRAYHDVMMHAMRASKLHSAPKLKLKCRDIDAFLKRNFSENEIADGKINLAGREFILLEDEDDADYIQVQSAIGSSRELLEFLFLCIVDVSETPEFAFGAAVASSKASVGEQMIPLQKKVLRKRGQFEEGYQRLARMLLAMYAATEFDESLTFSHYETTLEWPKLDDRADVDEANAIKSVVDALDTALAGRFISHQAAVEFLRRYVDTIAQYEDEGEKEGELKRIGKTLLLLQALADGQYTTEQLTEIEKELGVPAPKGTGPSDSLLLPPSTTSAGALRQPSGTAATAQPSSGTGSVA